MRAFSLSILTVLFWLSTNMPPTAAGEKTPPEEPGAVQPYDLRVEHMSDPRGIDERKPLFSWKLQSKENGQLQSAYRLTVARVNAQGTREPVWDTGNVPGRAQNLLYAGKPLEPASRYCWTLTVRDKPTDASTSLDDSPGKSDNIIGVRRGKPSRPVEAIFSTGLFATANDTAPWKGKWIGLDTPADKEKPISLDGAYWIAPVSTQGLAMPIGKSVYRRTVAIPADGTILSARLAIAADNQHVTFVNGKEVTTGSSFKMAPLVDITKLLVPGRNVIVVEANNRGDAPNPGGCVGAVEILYAQGPETTKSLRVVTDADWKAVEGTPRGAPDAAFDDTGWAKARVQCKVGEGPWNEIAVGTPEPQSIPARHLVKDFEPDDISRIARVTASICGLGYYELYINDRKVGDHKLDPVLTDYDKRVPYVTYDIDPQSLEDTNRIAVVLGSGRYYAPRQNQPTSTRTFGYPKLLFQLEILYKDGTKKTIVSDESWQVTTDGPIRENNDYDGEIYDARLESLENAVWRPVELVAAPKGRLVAQMMPPMRAVEELTPQSVKEVRPGVWVYDFGVNLVGRFRLQLPRAVPAGTELLLRFAETLQTDGPDQGMLYTANLRGAKCRDIYTAAEAASAESKIYEPVFTYHGFRYAEITGLPPGVKATRAMLTALAINSDVKKVSRFETSNATINQIYKNIVRGVQGNYLSIPTDCPQRDERQGWQGDRAGEAKGEMFLFDNVTLYAKWLIDIEDSQREDGNLSDVCPNYWPLYRPNVTWPSAFTIIPGSIETMYGDRRPIERHYGAMKRWLLDYLGPFVQDGIIDKDNYGDWCVPPEEKTLIHSQDPARKTAKPLLATAYYIYNLKLLAKYAGMLDKSEDVPVLLRKAEEMSRAFNTKFYDAASGKYDNGTQTSCVLPLAFGLVPPGDEDKVFRTLIANIENVTNRHIGTGLIGGQWLNRILTERGRGDLSYTFATNRTYPSWGYMIENGATTIWELWNGNTADPAMNSGNHVMLVGDLAIWFFEDLAGIKADPQRPGFDHVLMRPKIFGDLTFVDAEFDSPRGTITSAWKLENASFRWTIAIPCGATATVRVPTSKPESVRCDGAVEKIEPGTYRVPSGRYVFTVER